MTSPEPTPDTATLAARLRNLDLHELCEAWSADQIEMTDSSAERYEAAHDAVSTVIDEAIDALAAAERETAEARARLEGSREFINGERTRQRVALDAARAELAAAVQDSGQAKAALERIADTIPELDGLPTGRVLKGLEHVHQIAAAALAVSSAEATGQTETTPPADTCVCGCPKRAHQVEVAPATMPGWYSPPIHDCINHDGCRYQLAAPAAAGDDTAGDQR